jgi:hypothetical protein
MLRVGTVGCGIRLSKFYASASSPMACFFTITAANKSYKCERIVDKY